MAMDLLFSSTVYNWIAVWSFYHLYNSFFEVVYCAIYSFNLFIYFEVSSSTGIFVSTIPVTGRLSTYTSLRIVHAVDNVQHDMPNYRHLFTSVFSFSTLLFSPSATICCVLLHLLSLVIVLHLRLPPLVNYFSLHMNISCPYLQLQPLYRFIFPEQVIERPSQSVNVNGPFSLLHLQRPSGKCCNLGVMQQINHLQLCRTISFNMFVSAYKNLTYFISHLHTFPEAFPPQLHLLSLIIRSLSSQMVNRLSLI